MDLNLMRTLVAIYDEGSLTGAALELNVTQPSVSHALSRLRTQFSDPLFFRIRRGVVPSSLANELYTVFKEALVKVDAAVADSSQFDPSTATRLFRLCLTDMGELGILPRILASVTRTAPGIELEVIPMEIDSVGNWLRFGEVDVAIASTVIVGDVDSVPLMEERYQCLIPHDLELDGDRLTLEQFTSLPHAVVARATGHVAVEVELGRLGLTRKTAVTLKHFAVLPQLVETCGLIAVVPSGFGDTLVGKRSLRLVELPFDLPSFTVSLYWQARRSDAAQRWLRDIIRFAMSGSEQNG
jgi:DNA-binding transcriptional LysR family regulator